MKKSRKSSRTKSAASRIKSAASIANKASAKKGLTFEKKNDFKLTSNGIACNKRRISTLSGDYIADHSYVGKSCIMWGESTLSLDMKKAKELVTKRVDVLKVRPEINSWVLYYDHDSTKKSRTNISGAIAYLEKNGWKVFVGEEEIATHIEVFRKNEGISDVIPVAKVVQIEIGKIIKNEKNRKKKEEQIPKIAKSIIKHGFTSNLMVVPQYVRGRFTGKYILFDGHHRLAAVEYVIEKYGYNPENFKTLPCVLVDWVTSENIQELHDLLTVTNWTATKWQLRDYIRSYMKHFEEIKDKKAAESYKFLYDSYKVSKKSGLPEGTLVYRIGPVSQTSGTLSMDIDIIRRGEYRSQPKERDLKTQFTMECLIPFETWFNSTSNPRRVNDVSKVFSRKLIQDFITKKRTIEECISYCEAFKTLGINAPVNKKDVVDRQLWKKLDSIVRKAA